MDAVGVYHTFTELFPTPFEFMVLYHLYSTDRATGFEYNDIRQAIRETARMPFGGGDGKEPQVEKNLKSLLRSFLERQPGKAGVYLLTPHAEKIIEIVLHRIDNPYLKFPLQKTFEDYFKWTEDTGSNLAELEKWYRLGFQDNARKVVLSHLEGLKQSVEDAIKDLNQVLETDHLSALQMLERFTTKFQFLSMQARQISAAISMKTDVHYQLRHMADNFRQEPFVSEHTSALTNTAWKTASRIKEEVYAFFERVDLQLGLINKKMAFASYKISELQESLKAQSQFKLKLKKTLAWLLEHSKADVKGWVQLPTQFPKKAHVYQKFQFNTLRYYDLGFLKNASAIDPGLDADYEATHRNAFEQELKDQLFIQQQVETWQQQLQTDQQLLLSEEMLSLAATLPNGVYLSVQAGYELIRNVDKRAVLSIKHTLQSDPSNTFHLWKTTIRNR